MAKFRKCPICKSRSPRRVCPKTSPPPKNPVQINVTEKYFGLHGEMVKCSICGFTYIGEKAFVTKVARLYRRMSDETYITEEKERRRGFMRILSKIEKIKKKKGVLLDVGCCSGILLSEARSRGWKVQGIDPSLWATQTAKKLHHIKIVNSTLESYKNSGLRFDAITMLDVLEHVINPKSVLSKIHKLLKSDGVFCLVTPDYGSLTAKILGKRWWGIRLAHLSYFRRSDIDSLLEMSRFHVIEERTYFRFFSLYYILVRLIPAIESNFFIKNLLKKITIPLVFFDTFEFYLSKKK